MGLFKRLFGKTSKSAAPTAKPTPSTAKPAPPKTKPTPTAAPRRDSNSNADARLGEATKWFRNSEIRRQPRSPGDFIVTGDGAIPYAPIAKWLPEVSRDPRTTRMGIVPIRNLSTVLPSLSARFREDHGVGDEDLKSLFNVYLGIVCIDCLAGITVDLLRTVSTYSKAAGVVISDNSVARLLDGKCHSCDFDHYGIIWFGESRK